MSALKHTAAGVINLYARADAIANRLADDLGADEADFIAAAADAYRLRLMRRALREEFTRRRLAGAD
jgi:hypothetical protein